MILPSFSLRMSNVSRKRLSFLCAITLVVLFIFFFWRAEQRGLLAMTSTNNQQFTELYFTDTKAFPQKMVSGSRYSIPFAVASHEAAPFTYAYRIHVMEGGKTTITDPLELTLAPGDRAIRAAPFTVHDPAQPLAVTVELINKQQTITFRVTK
ncbi:MAG TPA: hypothetical protein VF733_02680 [Candidatus Saccharimonadales bacterium]